MSDKEAMETVAESFGVSPFVLSMLIEGYRKYKEVRFGPIELHGESLVDFEHYVKEQRELSRAINPKNKQYDFTLNLIDVYQSEVEV